MLESWPDRVLTMQRNWIGRSEGAEIIFRVEGTEIDVPVFTTRPDTLFGATFFVLAPEHPLVDELISGTEHEEEARAYIRRAAARTAVERAEKEKDGVFTGRSVVNPATGEPIPILIADYVLMEYGTGAIMGVPAHDERDYEFAAALRDPDPPVVAPAGGEPPEAGAYVAHTNDEVLVNSGEFTGLPAPEGMRKIVEWLEPRSSAGRWSAIASATGCCRGSATGAARSRSSTATSAVWYPCLTRTCPCSCRRSTSTSPRGGHRSPRPRTGSRPRARSAAARRSARPTRWTRSSTRPGTTCATRILRTTRRRSAGTSSTTGCR